MQALRQDLFGRWRANGSSKSQATTISSQQHAFHVENKAHRIPESFFARDDCGDSGHTTASDSSDFD
jgi:hypothetical protein